MKGKLTARQIFLLFALPAVDDCVFNEKGEICKKLKRALEYPDTITIEEIARIFKMPFEKFSDLKGNFCIERVKQYWEGEHNQIIEKMNWPLAAKELCKTHEVQIDSINLEEKIALTTKGEKIIVPEYHLKDLKPKDNVWIHKAQIAIIKED